MPGTLFVVATPIGNLEDITLRALRVLREVDLIAAEDTRRTARLLVHHAIQTPTISFHTHNAHGRLPQLISRLESGCSIAVVTDAGMPGVSDPGSELVRASVNAGIRVDPVPGASAPLAAAVVSGFPVIPLTVLGFPPYRSKDRSEWMLGLAAIPHTATFFEAPHRVSGTLGIAAIILGDRPICLGREITKVHQEFMRGTARELLEQVGSAPRGEFTIVVGPLAKYETLQVPGDDDILKLFGQTTDTGAASRRGAISAVARKLGISPKQVYAAIERAKSGDSQR